MAEGAIDVAAEVIITESRSLHTQSAPQVYGLAESSMLNSKHHYESIIVSAGLTFHYL